MKQRTFTHVRAQTTPAGFVGGDRSHGGSTFIGAAPAAHPRSVIIGERLRKLRLEHVSADALHKIEAVRANTLIIFADHNLDNKIPVGS